MNAQSVWGGHEYAYVHYVRKQHFPMDAIRVKVISTRKVQSGYKSRADAFATVEFVDNPDRPQREVNVRNLYDFWDSYQDEKQGRLDEQEKKAREAAEEAERRRQEREAARQKQNAIAERLAWKLGIDPSVVTVSHYGDSVNIAMSHLEFLMED